MSDSVSVDGVAVGADTDWRTRIAAHLAGPPVWSQREDRSPLDGLTRLWRTLSDAAPQWLGEVGAALASELWSSPVGMAVGARFFSNFSGAPGADDFRRELVARWAKIPSTLDNPLPGGKAPKLRDELLRCALQSAPKEVAVDASLLDLIRRETLASGGAAQAVITPLALRDYPWVAQNAETILRAHPEAGYGLALAMEFAGQKPEDAVRWVFRHAPAVSRRDFAWYIRRIVPTEAQAELLTQLASLSDLPSPA